MKVSIALAAYNGAHFIRQQLDSFSSQTVLPDELIISDDGSTDGTLEICNRFADSAKFMVKIVRNETNLGYARNFQQAMAACSGEIVFLSDQDDVWYPDKLEKVLAVFRDDPSAHLVIHDLEYCDSALKRLGERKIQRMHGYLPIEKYVTGMATAVRREFLDHALPFPDIAVAVMGHDTWLHRLSLLIDGKRVIHEPLADYRRHETNATANKILNDISFSNVDLISRKKKESRNHLAVSTEKLRTKHAVYSALENRAKSMKGHFELNKSSYDQLCVMVVALENRLRVFSQPRHKRFFAVVRLLRNGGYAQFSGIRSAIKDAIYN